MDGRRDEILRLHDSKGHDVPVLPMALCTAIEEGCDEHRFQVVQTAPRSLRVQVESARGARDVAARIRNALTQFLGRQGLAGVAVRVQEGKIAAHPVSGKFRQVWREKPRHAA